VPLAGLTNLSVLYLDGNQITDTTPLVGLTSLRGLNLAYNQVTDLDPLIQNAANGGLGQGEPLYLWGNPLSNFARTNQIPILESFGIRIFD